MPSSSRALSLTVRSGYRYVGQHWLWILSGVFILIIGIVLSGSVYVFNQQITRPQAEYNNLLANQKQVLPIFYSYSGIHQQFKASINSWQPTNPTYLSSLKESYSPLRSDLQLLIDSSKSAELNLVDFTNQASFGLQSRDIIRSIGGESNKIVSLIDFQICISAKQLSILDKLQEVSSAQLKLPETPKTEEVTSLYTSITKSYNEAQIEVDKYQDCFGISRGVDMNSSIQGIIDRTKVQFTALASNTQQILDSVNNKDESQYNRLLDQLTETTKTTLPLLITTTEDWLGEYLVRSDINREAIDKQVKELEKQAKVV